MKKLTIALTVTLALLLLAAPALATTFHTITVDGNMTDWAADELMETDNGGDFYVTWDETSLYVGLANVNVDGNGVFFVYFDVIPAQGSNQGLNWNGVHTLPFDADYGIAADSGGNLGWLVESGGAWNWNTFPGANYVGWADVPNSELQIPWSEMGNPDTLYLMAFFQNQGDNGVTASWPTLNPANNSGSETFTNFYHFSSLGDGVSPHDSVLSEPLLNEFVLNHVGTDTNEYVELFANPNTDYSAYTIVEIEGDSGTTGLIDDGTLPVGVTDADGFWFTGYLNNVYENGSVTLLLVRDYYGSVNQDLDTDDDGVLDVTPWSIIADSVAVYDGGAGDLVYSDVALAPGFDGSAFTPGGASRIPNGFDTDAVSDWMRNNFDGAGLPGFTGVLIFGEALNTPNTFNVSANNVAVAKSGPDSVTQGDAFVYTIQFSVTAGVAADAYITDDLPAEVSFVDYRSNAALALLNQPDPLVWRVDQALLTDTLYSLWLTVTADSVGDALNQVFITATQDVTGSDNSAWVQTSILPGVVYTVTYIYLDEEGVLAAGDELCNHAEIDGWNDACLPYDAGGSYTYVYTTPITGTFAYKYWITGTGVSHWDWITPPSVNFSAEISETVTIVNHRALNVDWCGNIWPPVLTEYVGMETDTVYGQLYINGLTNEASPGPGVAVHLGWGDNDDPAGWSDWFGMGFNGDVGNNDEYMGAMLAPAAPGAYTYTVRFDPNWGASNPNAGWTTCGLYPLTVEPLPDLLVTKDVYPQSNVPLTGSVIYTVMLYNNTASDVASIVLTDELPTEVDFGDWLISPTNVSLIGDIITWSGLISANQSITLVFSADLTGAAGYGQSVTNTVVFTSPVVGGSDDAVFTTEPAPLPITFVYHDLEDVIASGEAVYLAGSFNGWSPTATLMNPDALFETFAATLTLLAGDYEYRYIVYTDTLPSGPPNWNWLQSNNRSVSLIDPGALDDHRHIQPGYVVIQWPHVTTTTVNVATENIYGQIWADDLTARPGEPRALLAELGYGVDIDPANWTDWTAMSWGSQQGNNDEFAGVITPTAVGVYSYVVRFNGNWGLGNPHDQWTYGDTDGVSPGDPFEIENAGVLHVIDAGPQPSLVISKAVDNPTPMLGDSIVYTITVANQGDSDALAVHITDTLPAGLSGAGLDETADIPAGEQVVYTIAATVNDDPNNYYQTIVNTANFSHASGSGSDDAVIETVSPELRITKAASPSNNVPYHGYVTYTIALENRSDLIPALGALLTDELPAQVDFYQWINQPGGAVVSDDVLTWSGDVAADETVSFVFMVQHVGEYNDLVSNRVDYRHYAAAGHATRLFSVEDQPAGPALSIAKSAYPTDSVAYHGPVTYTIALENSGLGDAVGATLTDALPISVTFAHWLPGGQPAGAVLADDVLTWNGTVTGSALITFSFVVSHTGDYAETITNTAEYRCAEDSSAASASFVVETGGQPQPLLSILKDVSPAADVPLTSFVIYTITLRNSGDAAAAGVLMSDVLPLGLDFGGWLAQSGAQAVSNTITWSDDLAADTDVAIVFTATLTSGEPGASVTNVAEYSSANAGAGSDSAVFTIEGVDVYMIYLPIVTKQAP